MSVLTALFDKIDQTLDDEWIELLLEARNLGLTPEEVREFIDKSSQE